MRTLVLAAGTFLLTACSSTMSEPGLLVSPYLAVYQLRGKIGMQSEPSPGTVQDNARTTLRDFGQDHYREDVGVRVDLGDGFGGLRFDYYRLDQGTAATGTLAADFGALRAGDTVQMDATMDEFRVGYVEPIVNLKTMWRDRPLSLRAGIGAVLAHRDLDLRAKTTDGARQQHVSSSGDVVYPAARARVAWREFALDAEYAISPHAVLGGDFDGTLQDIEVRASYTLQQRDMTFFAAWRYSDLPADGSTGGLRWDADLVLDGFQFGVVLTF